MTCSSSPEPSGGLADRVVQWLSQERPLYYAMLAPDLTVIQASENLPEILETSHPKPEGLPISELFLEFVGSEEALKEVLSGTAPAYLIETVNREQPDGSIRYLKFHALPLDASQAGQGLLLVIEDATQACQLEQQLVQDRNELRLAQAQLQRLNQELVRLNRQKSLFLSIAAHDLRAPLTVILGSASLLLATASQLPQAVSNQQAELSEGLAMICSQVDKLNRLVSDFLDLDQIEQGKLVLRPTRCDLIPLVEEVAAALKPQAESKQQTLSLDLAPSPPLLADPERVRQILYNLISNAIKFTPEGGRIEVHVHPDGQAVSLIVKDNGWGIPASEMDQLFQLYYRAAEARRSQARGHGLGLYIVKSLVDAHHGRIAVQSQPGQGTQFTVHLPVDPGPGAA